MTHDTEHRRQALALAYQYAVEVLAEDEPGTDPGEVAIIASDYARMFWKDWLAEVRVGCTAPAPMGVQ